MNGSEDFYEEVDDFESFEGLEYADELRLPFLPGRKIRVPGGLSSATLNTPKGPAKLNLPSPVPTLAQFRALEQAVNGLTQRLNATNAQLLQTRRQLATRGDSSGMGSMGMIFTMLGQRKLRDALEGHTHTADNTPPTLPADSSKLDSMLPFLMLQPNMFGGSGAKAAGGGDAMSPMLMALLFMD